MIDRSPPEVDEGSEGLVDEDRLVGVSRTVGVLGDL